MKNKLIVIATLTLFVLVGFPGCAKDEPKEKLPEWIIARLDNNHDIVTVYKGEFKGRTVYWLRDIYSSCAYCLLYYEEGEYINSLSEIHEITENQNWVLVYEYP